tara:strand:- start:163 stop:1020 length:858 start_codon:yes stop_codon:yes gene_type:complete
MDNKSNKSYKNKVQPRVFINDEDLKVSRKINILDWLILIVVLMIIFVVYTPLSIWSEEDFYRIESRNNMLVVNDAQKFYYELTGRYTTDTTILFQLVEQSMDSLKMDSLFYGERVIKIDRSSLSLNDTLINVNLEKDFHKRVDTTFSAPVNLYIDKIDTIYTIVMNSEVDDTEQIFDTLFVNNDRLSIYTDDDYNFKGVIDTTIVSRSEKMTDYYRNKFHLESSFLYCPISGDPYVLSIDSLDDREVFNIESPLPPKYSERRYLFFKFYSGEHGSIKDGYTSWIN